MSSEMIVSPLETSLPDISWELGPEIWGIPSLCLSSYDPITQKLNNIRLKQMLPVVLA